MIPDIPYVFPDYHTTACALQCLAQTLKNIEVAREHVDHLSRILLPSKPGQFSELIDKSRQRLDRIYLELDDTFYLIFVLLKEQFDSDQLIENESNPKLIKKGGKIEISPIGWLKKESDQQEDPLWPQRLKINRIAPLNLKMSFPPLNRSPSYDNRHLPYSDSRPPPYHQTHQVSRRNVMSKYDKNDILSTLLTCNTCSCLSIITVIIISFLWLYSRLDRLDEILKLLKEM